MFGKMFDMYQIQSRQKEERSFLCHVKSDQTIGRNSNLYIMERLLKVNVNAAKFMEYVTVV